MSQNNSDSRKSTIVITISVTCAIALMAYFYITYAMNPHAVHPKGAAQSRYEHFWLPDSESTYAPEIDSIFNIILWITMVVFVLVEVGLVYFLWKYRHRVGRKAVYTHGNNRLEIAWTIVPAVILVFL